MTRPGYVWRPTRYIEAVTEQGWHSGFRALNLKVDDDRSVVAGGNVNAVAAAILFRNHQQDGNPPKVVAFAAGRPGYLASDPDKTLSEGRILKERFLRLVRPPATTEIIIQDRNKDTRDDLFESLNLVRERGLSGVAIITIELHLPRTKEFLKMTVDENPSLAGIDVIFIPAEGILAARNQRYARVFSAVQKTKAWQRTQKMEESGVEALRHGRYIFR